MQEALFVAIDSDKWETLHTKNLLEIANQGVVLVKTL